MVYILDKKVEEYARSVANPDYPLPSGGTTPGQRYLKRNVLDLTHKAFLLTPKYEASIMAIAKAYSALRRRTPGEDNIELPHLELLGESTMIRYLKGLFGQVINQRHVPNAFRSSIVLPIPKRGKKLEKTESWGPIHLISIVGKLYGKFLPPEIVCAIEDHLSPLQFAYRKGLSTEQAIIYTIDTLKQSNVSIMVNFDLSRAFERV